MTREEKLYSMRGIELIAEAEKLGVKVAHKGNSLKESKEKAIQKILAADSTTVVIEEVTEVEEPETKIEEPVEVEPIIESITEPEPKEKKTRAKTKKTFEELVAEIPAVDNVRFIKSAKGDVHVKMGTDHNRLFGYTGTVIVIGVEKYITGLDAEKKSYGWVVAPTYENMMRIFQNYNV